MIEKTEIAAQLQKEAQLIRRERIATAALQGLLSSPRDWYLKEFDANHYTDAVQAAIYYADALIAKLDKEGGK